MSTPTISAKDVKALRDLTGAGMMDCKKALQETGGDVDGAVTYLREKGIAGAAKLGGREATEGTVQSYIHANGKVGVLVEVDCNTDFVAKNDDFTAFARDIALHIAASPSTRWVSEEEVPEDVRAEELRIAASQMTNVPEHARERAASGKVVQVARGGRPPQAGPRQRREVREQDHRAAADGAVRAHGRERRHPALRALRRRRGLSRPEDGRRLRARASVQPDPPEAVRRGADGQP